MAVNIAAFSIKRLESFRFVWIFVESVINENVASRRGLLILQSMNKIAFILTIDLLLTMPVIGQKQHFVDFWEGGIKKSEGFYERGFEHGTWKYYYQ